MIPIRKPAVAGLFYPKDARELKCAIRELLKEKTPEDHSKKIDSKIRGIMVPHAGYPYSGRVAAHSFSKLLDLQFDIVVVISPSHRDYFEGVSIYGGDYETPLGVIPCDPDLRAQLIDNSDVVHISELGHREEHGIEVELPFLQYILGDFKLLPLVMGSQDWRTAGALAHAMEACLPEKSLIVASSDLSHFHTQEKANYLDRLLIRGIESMNEKKIYEDIETHKTEACGYGAIISTIMALKMKGVTKSTVLDYKTSGDVTGDLSEVVGYASAVFQ